MLLKKFLSKSKPTLVAIFIYFVIWWFLSLFFDEFIIPSPGKVLLSLHSFENIVFNIAATAYRIFIAFLLSFILGTLTSISFYRFNFRRYISSSLSVMQVIPGTILALILFLVFGEGSIVPIVLISAVIFPLFVNQTFSSLNKIPKERIEACQLFGGDRIDLLRYVYFPELYPNLKNTGITAIGLASKIVVLGEFIGSSNGIGFGLNNAKTFYKMDEVFGYLLIIIILNLVLQLTFFAFLKLLDNLLTK